MRLIANEDIVLNACDLDITVAKKGELLDVVTQGYGYYEVRPASDSNAETFTVKETQVSLS